MFDAASVPFGSQCEEEEQTRLCTDGVFGAWSGNFAEAACVVREQWPPASGILQLGERSGNFPSVSPDGGAVAWVAVDESGLAAHAYWRLLTRPDANIVELGETNWAVGVVDAAESGVVAFVNKTGEACAGTALASTLPCFGSGVRTVALSPDGGTLAYASASEIVVKHLASGTETLLAVESSGKLALSVFGGAIAYSAAGEVFYAAPPGGTAVAVGTGFNPTLAVRGGAYVAFQSLPNSSMHGPPSLGAQVEVPWSTEVTIAGGGSHIAYRTHGTAPNLVVVRDIGTGATTTVLAANGSEPAGNCEKPSLSADAAVLGLSSEGQLAEDGAAFDDETIISLPFVVWLKP